jgi:junctophilin
MRHGYGVRQSAPYGTGPTANAAAQMGPVRGSIQSLASEVGRSKSAQVMRPSSVAGSTEGGQRGFVLVGRPRFGGSESNLVGSGRRNSLVDKNGQTRRSGGLLRGLRLKKQRSTGDIDMRTLGSTTTGIHSVSSSIDSISGRLKGKTNSVAVLGKQNSVDTGSNAAFVSQDADITDPSTVETYMGEWKNDRRCGFGICDRSDGLR